MGALRIGEWQSDLTRRLAAAMDGFAEKQGST